MDGKKTSSLEMIVNRGLQLRDSDVFDFPTQSLLSLKYNYTYRVPQSSIPSDNVVDEAVNEEMDTSLVRAATTATSLDAE
ncbi:hypothetical protein Tco_1021122 [Tanacetum coccineum]